MIKSLINKKTTEIGLLFVLEQDADAGRCVNDAAIVDKFAGRLIDLETGERV